MAVAIALAIGASGSGPVKRGDGPGPATDPNNPAAAAVRSIVYSDIVWTDTGDVDGDTVQYGTKKVDIGGGFVHLDVTDDGFFFTSRGGVWFSDGGKPEQVGSHLCAASPNGEFSNFANRAVMTANSGSTAAWFDCARPGRATLVIYDTSSRRELARRPVPMCGCVLLGVTSDYVYFDRGDYVGWPRPDYRFGVTTHHLEATTPESHAEDLRSHPRGLVVGNSWQRGRPTDAIDQRFWVDGSLLVPIDDRWAEPVPEAAFDTVTQQPVKLHLPRGYHADHDEMGRGDFSLFEWLDDDTVALVGGGDILRCQISSGRCVVAVRRPADGAGEEKRIIPGLPLPG
jgi:hypothetical protein